MEFNDVSLEFSWDVDDFVSAIKGMAEKYPEMPTSEEVSENIKKIFSEHFGVSDKDDKPEHKQDEECGKCECKTEQPKYCKDCEYFCSAENSCGQLFDVLGKNISVREKDRCTKFKEKEIHENASNKILKSQVSEMLYAIWKLGYNFIIPNGDKIWIVKEDAGNIIKFDCRIEIKDIDTIRIIYKVYGCCINRRSVFIESEEKGICSVYTGASMEEALNRFRVI